MPSSEPLSKFYEYLNKNGSSAIIAPTSYGKTMYSPELLERSREDGLSHGLIHVTPYRSLVREIFLEKFSKFTGKFSIGYQSMDVLEDGADKSPFFLRDLVVTTLDSYVWNAFGIPVVEFDKIVKGASLGHGYVAGMSIATSTTIFDEAHVFIGSGTERAVFAMVLASITYLSYMDIPFAIESATIPSVKLRHLLRILEKGLQLVYVCRSSDCRHSPQAPNYKALLGDNFHPVSDKDWYDSKVFKWKTHLIKQEEIIKYAVDICRSKPLLVIRNTIQIAVDTYKKLKELCPQALLIHGWIGSKDREEKINAVKKLLREEKPGAIVATQVIEAGVEAEAHSLITDIAPIDNLAQRVGRLCRKNTEGLCRDDGVDIYIVTDGPYRGVYNERIVEKTLEKLEKYTSYSSSSIDWRLLEDPENGDTRVRSFTKIMEEVYQDTRVPYGNLSTIHSLANILSLDLPSNSILKILDRVLKEELSETTLVKLVPGDEEDNFVVIELGRLMSLLKRMPKSLGKCLGASGEDILVFKVRMSGDKEIPVRLRGNISPIALTRSVYQAARAEVSEELSIRDYYIPLREECYSNEMGAFYNVAL